MMFGSKSPIEAAYNDAVGHRLRSIVYLSLNEGVHPEGRRGFRKDWGERGTYHLVHLLKQSASPEWNSYPETFWISPWVAKHLQETDANSLFYIVDQWLADEPLPDFIDPDPLVEDQKVKDLHRLFSALNR
jgi:hypothetical protein